MVGGDENFQPPFFSQITYIIKAGNQYSEIIINYKSGLLPIKAQPQLHYNFYGSRRFRK